LISSILNSIFLTNRFFGLFGVVIALCACGFVAPILFIVAVTLLLVLLAVTITDGIFVLYSRGRVFCERHIPKVFPLGDAVRVELNFKSSFPYPLKAMIIDEWPEEFQKRDFKIPFDLPANGKRSVTYSMRALNRGIFRFGDCNLFLNSRFGLVQYRCRFKLEEEFSVYPSILQMKKHELAAIRNVFQFQGAKKMRRLGHSYEFEQIKNYVQGDDYRSVNWKATGRKGELMVNQYGDERSQQVYSIIDKSRVMKLPFNGLSLMDHAINTSLVISNIALLKHDKAGMISFADKIGTIIKADNRVNQLRRILEALHREEPADLEANYQLLYTASKRIIKQRSLIILYTNFESSQALKRVIPLLRRINRLHLLLVVFFENSEIREYSETQANDLLDIYNTTLAGKFNLDKKTMVKQLNQYGIQTLLTKPEDLSVNTVNKYLEFKSRGWI